MNWLFTKVIKLVTVKALHAANQALKHSLILESQFTVSIHAAHLEIDRNVSSARRNFETAFNKKRAQFWTAYHQKHISGHCDDVLLLP